MTSVAALLAPEVLREEAGEYLQRAGEVLQAGGAGAPWGANGLVAHLISAATRHFGGSGGTRCDLRLRTTHEVRVGAAGRTR